MTATPQDVRRRAGEFVDEPALLGTPIAVRDASGTVSSWFVPLVAGDRLTGFVELLPDLTHRRTSRFADPPPASSWLDPAAIGDRASTAMAPGETAGDPYLSFDGAPDRIAWAVPVHSGDGDRLVFVAGDAVWPGGGRDDPAAGSVGDAR